MDCILKIDCITKKYGKSIVLDNFSMSIKKGDIYGLIGANGAGKSTIMKIILGLDNFSTGSFKLFNIDSKNNNINISKKKCGAIIESPAIYLNLNAYDNLKNQCYLIGVNNYNLEIERVLNMVGLDYLQNESKKAENYSLGMKQRLGLAIALIGFPEFIILDEPVNGLDPQGIVDIRNLILTLNRNYGITFLISSHLLDELSKIATDFGFILSGKMIKEVSKKEIEKECFQGIKIIVDSNNIEHIIKSFNIKKYIYSNNEIIIKDDDFIINNFISHLNKENIRVLNIERIEQTLEQYYLKYII